MVAGDSNALAARPPAVTVAQSWPQLVANARGSTLVNTAIGGQTSAQIKARLPGDLALHSPEVLAIMMSANDSANGVSVSQGRQNMIDMIDMGQQAGARVTILMHHPFFHDGGTWLHGVGKQTYSFMKELGGLPDVQFVDVFDAFTRHLYYSGYNGSLASSSNPVMIPLYAPTASGTPDWIHLSAVGQSIPYDAVMMNPRACA